MVEEELSFHPSHSLSNDSSILNSKQNFPVIALEAEEESSSSLSNVSSGVEKIYLLDFLEVISYFGSDKFSLAFPVLPRDSYLIVCSNSHNFIEDGENCEFSLFMA